MRASLRFSLDDPAGVGCVRGRVDHFMMNRSTNFRASPWSSNRALRGSRVLLRASDKLVLREKWAALRQKLHLTECCRAVEASLGLSPSEGPFGPNIPDSFAERTWTPSDRSFARFHHSTARLRVQPLLSVVIHLELFIVSPHQVLRIHSRPTFLATHSYAIPSRIPLLLSFIPWVGATGLGLRFSWFFLVRIENFHSVILFILLW